MHNRIRTTKLKWGFAGARITSVTNEKKLWRAINRHMLKDMLYRERRRSGHEHSSVWYNIILRCNLPACYLGGIPNLYTSSACSAKHDDQRNLGSCHRLNSGSKSLQRFQDWQALSQDLLVHHTNVIPYAK